MDTDLRRNMSAKNLQTPRFSQLKNYIPSGRQLPRTPPMTNVNKHLSFSEPDVDCPSPDRNPELESRDEDEQSRALGCCHFETDAPDSMLKGMKGYQITESDLEFIKKMKEEQVTKKLQGNLKEIQKQLQKEMMALELADATRKMVLTELDKFPSSEDLTTWSKLVLRNTSPWEFDDIDVKSLLSMVTVEKIQSFINEKEEEMDQIERTKAEMRKRHSEERGQLERQIATEELNIQELMRQLVDLKSNLSEQKEFLDVKEEVDNFVKPQAAKSKAKRQEKEGKGVKIPGGPQKTIEGKSTRHRRINKTDVLSTIPGENLQQKPGALPESKPLKASREKPQKVEQGNVSEVSGRAERGRRKPAGAAQKTDQKAKSQRVTFEGRLTKSRQVSHRQEEQEGAQDVGLRRSKRIANRKAV